MALQTKDETKSVPIALERGKNKQIQNIRLAYTLLSGLSHAHTARIFLFKNEGQGFHKALSHPHNAARFRNRIVMLPIRERKQKIEYEEKQKGKGEKQKRKDAIKILKYTRRYSRFLDLSEVMERIDKCKMAGIVIK